MEVLSNFTITCGRDIVEAFDKIDHTFYVAHLKKFKPDHVFDEDKSVKWNRDEVVRRNQDLADAYLLAREYKAKSLDFLDEAIYKYIMEESVYDTKFTRQEAELIWKNAKKHHEAEPWNWIDEMAETIRDFRNIQKGALS